MTPVDSFANRESMREMYFALFGKFTHSDHMHYLQAQCSMRFCSGFAGAPSIIDGAEAGSRIVLGYPVDLSGLNRLLTS